jgi:hypothetical protein
MESIVEEAETATASVTEQPKAAKKGKAGARGAHVAPKKGKAGKKTAAAKKAPKSAKKATGARDGSKAAKVLDLLKRPGGATAKELMKATGWQPHSVRGFLSGTVGRSWDRPLRPRRGRMASGLIPSKAESPNCQSRAAGYNPGGVFCSSVFTLLPSGSWNTCWSATHNSSARSPECRRACRSRL